VSITYRETNGKVEEIEDRGPGRKLVALDCPFCGNEVVGFLWSIAGVGKRCACGAVVGLRGARKVAAALLLALASPLAAQEPEPPAPSLADYIAPAAWCPLRSGSEPDGFGCDGGLAVSLIDRSIGEHYTAVGVAFVGAETVGLGVAWCRGRLCAGAGVAATRDDFGIGLDSASPVIGATFSLGGLRE
jgi:hypothetical protein